MVSLELSTNVREQPVERKLRYGQSYDEVCGDRSTTAPLSHRIDLIDFLTCPTPVCKVHGNLFVSKLRDQLPSTLLQSEPYEENKANTVNWKSKFTSTSTKQSTAMATPSYPLLCLENPLLGMKARKFGAMIADRKMQIYKLLAIMK